LDHQADQPISIFEKCNLAGFEVVDTSNETNLASLYQVIQERILLANGFQGEAYVHLGDFFDKGAVYTALTAG